ncbi:MAG: outer membrane protein assembly factor BamB [Rhodothermales bacterium]|jgi:outer membrane protein assembly factor BamB
MNGFKITTPRHMFGPVLALLLVAGTSVAQKSEWTRFRGPNGTGISDATSIPSTWTEKDYNWTIDVPSGSSSPVVWGNRIFLAGSDAATGQRRVTCVSTADGSRIWQRDFPGKKYRMHRDNDFASATPCVDQHGLVLVWSSPEQLLMLALDLDGKEIWRRDLGPYKGMHGSASSPVIVDGMVVLANDQMNPVRMRQYLPKDASMVPGKSFLIAVDRKTGATRWQVDRRTELAGYATPCVRHIEGGAPELIFTGTAHGITSVDLASGTINWEISDVFASRTVGSPQLHGDLVFASHGAGLGGQRFVAVRPTPEAGARKAELVYEVKQSVPLVPSCLVKDDLLFLWAGNGIVTCLDAATGERHWRERVGGDYYCSPVWVDKRLYCVSKQGEVRVIAAAKTFKSLAKVALGERAFAVPAIANDVMYLRTQSRLFSLGGAELATGNLAKSATLTASSLQVKWEGEGPVEAVVDGNLKTRWSTAFADDSVTERDLAGDNAQHLTLDFGKSIQMRKVVLHWETAAAARFDLLISDDGISWHKAASKTDGPKGPRADSIDLTDAQGQYLKLDLHERATKYGYSLYEIEVH